MSKKIEDVYGKSILSMIFFNKDLQDKYLPVVLPGFYSTPEEKLIAFSMQLLQSKKARITTDTILIIQKSREVYRYKRKLKDTKLTLTSEYLTNFFYDLDVTNEPELFEGVWRSFHDVVFQSKALWLLFALKTHIEWNRRSYIPPYLDALRKLHTLVYARKYAKAEDQIRNTAKKINEQQKTIPMSSRILTSLCGGWTRGYPATFIGRASHAKSTFMTWESMWLLDNNYVPSVDVILCEEDASAFWSRVYSYVCKIPTTAIREGTVEITEKDIEKVEAKYKGKLRVHDGILKYEHLVDLLFTLKGEFIWIDHLNVVKYPGKSGAITNMIGGIPDLINREKQFLKVNKDKVIVNLTQPNEKVIDARRGHWKMPELTDAYASSILHQASREFLAGYYPYKDAVNNPYNWTGKKEPHENNDYYVGVRKSSYGDIGQVRFNFDFEFSSFKEIADRKPEVILPDNMFENFKVEKL